MYLSSRGGLNVQCGVKWRDAQREQSATGTEGLEELTALKHVINGFGYKSLG
ncbi:hypothetical protein [uncultured Phyllobacterium sp.]|uniref:hypothetical protein n=1 Tax=uncultured Phyllobacterium sp. TaxID=253813 RepID=UPI002585CE8B|nr:hypothetical protein [uncultured Phyllobacterium sp.]